MQAECEPRDKRIRLNVQCYSLNMFTAVFHFGNADIQNMIFGNVKYTERPYYKIIKICILLK